MKIKKRSVYVPGLTTNQKHGHGHGYTEIEHFYAFQRIGHNHPPAGWAWAQISKAWMVKARLRKMAEAGSG
jgi:hypothetical protein